METKIEEKKVEKTPEKKEELKKEVNIQKNEGKEVEKKGLMNKEFHLFRSKSVSQLKLAFAIRNLSIMLKSGLALEGAMTILSEQLDDYRLREIFNEILVDNKNGVLFHLHGAPEIIRHRIEARENHFMKPAMLDSQLAALEPPLDAHLLDVADSTQASRALRKFR